MFIADEVALSSDRRQLDSLPMQSRAKLLAVTAAFVPYYNHSAVRLRSSRTAPDDLAMHRAKIPSKLHWAASIARRRAAALTHCLLLKSCVLHQGQAYFLRL